MLGDQLLHLVDSGAAERLDQLLVLHEREGRHRADLVLAGDHVVLVHVHLQEEHVQQGVREGQNLRADRFTWSTPGS